MLGWFFWEQNWRTCVFFPCHLSDLWIYECIFSCTCNMFGCLGTSRTNSKQTKYLICIRCKIAKPAKFESSLISILLKVALVKWWIVTFGLTNNKLIARVSFLISSWCSLKALTHFLLTFLDFLAACKSRRPWTAVCHDLDQLTAGMWTPADFWICDKTIYISGGLVGRGDLIWVYGLLNALC